MRTVSPSATDEGREFADPHGPAHGALIRRMHRGDRQCKEQKQPRQQQQTTAPPSLTALSAAFLYRNPMPTDDDRVWAIDRRRR